jgi:HD-GYP domain-containing protein (c-di-GMP phosphodiesterase class II)
MLSSVDGVYKEPATRQKAVAMIREGAEIHFAHDIVNAFRKLAGQFQEVALKFGDSPPSS